MSDLRILIVEDEATVARRLERLTRISLGERISELAVAGSIEDAEKWLAGRDDAIMMLDLNLAGDDGFELLRRAVASPARVIIVSANTHRAVEAYEWGVVDFVPKPFDVDRLSLAFARACSRPEASAPPLRYLTASVAGKVDIACLEQVVRVSGAGDYAEIHLCSSETLLTSKTLARLENILPQTFLRVHRSHIVNLDFARRLHVFSGSRYELEMRDGTKVPVGRTSVAGLRGRLTGAT